MASFPPEIERELLCIVSQTSFVSGRLFVFSKSIPEMVTDKRSPLRSLREMRTDSLARALYLHHYCGVRTSVRLDTDDLLESLQQANRSEEVWEPGWQLVETLDSGDVRLRNADGTRLRVFPLERVRLQHMPEGPSLEFAVLRPRESIEQPGYYYAVGETAHVDHETSDELRIYLSVTSRSVLGWTTELTRRLNQSCVPFRLKTLRRSGAFVRSDAAVLYVSRRHAPLAMDITLEARRRIGGLRRSIPLFCRRLCQGVAIADSPPNSESFGMHRMRLVADALLDTAQHSSARATLRKIARRFELEDLDPSRPWLNPGNVDVVIARGCPPVKARPCSITRTSTWLDAADRIGAQLVREAFWNRDRCTWQGWHTHISSHGIAEARLGVIGPDVYSGTSGIAIFLGALAAVTSDARQRHCSLAALRQSIAQADEAELGSGGYDGVGGLVWATSALATALQDDELCTRILPRLLDRMRRAIYPSTDVDILSGRAGAIRVLLRVSADTFPRDSLLKIAHRLGIELVQAARKEGSEWSWRIASPYIDRALPGYSHGSAGIALALHDLFHATREPSFHEGALAAMNHVVSTFDGSQNDWPGISGQNRFRRASTWCHGAPGILRALSQYEARDTSVRTWLAPYRDAAVSTTAASIEHALSTSGSSFCLCHGIAGNADILLDETSPGDSPNVSTLIRSAAQFGIDNYNQTGTWPSGVPGGHKSPSLMLGLAGIGHFYLRLHDPSISSALSI